MSTASTRFRNSEKEHFLVSVSTLSSFLTRPSKKTPESEPQDLECSVRPIRTHCLSTQLILVIHGQCVMETYVRKQTLRATENYTIFPLKDVNGIQ